MNEMIKELIPYLDKIGEKLSVGAEQLWAMQLKQVYVLLASGMIKYVMWITFVLAGVVLIIKFFRDSKVLINELKLAQAEDCEIEKRKKAEYEKENEERNKRKNELRKEICDNYLPSYHLLMNGYRASYTHYETERLGDAKKAKKEHEEFILGVSFTWLTIATIIYIFCLPSITELITMLANPQYYALKEIINMVK